MLSGNFPREVSGQHLISAESRDNLTVDPHEVINGQNSMSHPHNTFIMFLAQFGIGGSILYLLLYGNMLYRTFKEWYKYKDSIDFIMFIIILNCVIRGLADYTLWIVAPATALFIIYGLYISYKAASTTNSNIINSKNYLLYSYGFIILIMILANTLRHLLKQIS